MSEMLEQYWDAYPVRQKAISRPLTKKQQIAVAVITVSLIETSAILFLIWWLVRNGYVKG